VPKEGLGVSSVWLGGLSFCPKNNVKDYSSHQHNCEESKPKPDNLGLYGRGKEIL
jgi:hypothetical protein